MLVSAYEEHFINLMKAVTNTIVPVLYPDLSLPQSRQPEILAITKREVHRCRR